MIGYILAGWLLAEAGRRLCELIIYWQGQPMPIDKQGPWAKALAIGGNVTFLVWLVTSGAAKA